MSEAWAAPVFALDASVEEVRAQVRDGLTHARANHAVTRRSAKPLTARLHASGRRRSSVAWIRTSLGGARRAALTEPRAELDTTGVGLDAWLRGVTWRRARVVALASIVVAAFAHAGLAVAGGNVRPQRARPKAVEMSVAVAQDDEVLADEAAPPPPAPKDTARTPTPAQSQATSTPSLAPPSLGTGVAGGLATPGFTIGGGAGGAATESRGIGDGRRVERALPVVTAAKPVTRAPPRFPSAARARGTTGHVVVSLLVDETGAVRDVRVLESAPPGVFDAAAIAAVQRWRFEPAHTDGRPTSSWVKQTVRFELD